MKKTILRTSLILFLAIAALALMMPAAVSAQDFERITTDCRFYGKVLLDGASVPAGTTVTAAIDGVSAGPWTTTVYIRGGVSRYVLDVPANKGNGLKIGGVNGDTVNFTVTVGGAAIPAPPAVFKMISTITHNIYLDSSVNPPIYITTESLPGAVVGDDSYIAAVSASGGTGPVNWSASGLPDGLSMSIDGLITGNPQPAESDYPLFVNRLATYNVQVTVVDSAGQNATKTIPLQVEWVKGDANGDGIVSVADATIVQRIILGLDPETPGADANEDGVVTVADIVKIQRIILELD